LVWFHIFTHPLSTPFGLVPHSIAGLAADLNRNGKWLLERYTKAFHEGLANGFMEYDEKALLIYFPKYFSPDNAQNYPANPNVVKGWVKWLMSMPESPLKDKCYQDFKSLTEGLGEPFRKAFMNASLNGIGNTETKTKTKTKTKRREEEAVPPPARKGKKAGRLITEDDRPTEKHREMAKRFQLDIEYEWENFSDYCKSVGRTYTDFEAAFSNSLRRSAERKGTVVAVRKKGLPIQMTKVAL
jgi:hypothetical protein